MILVYGMPAARSVQRGNCGDATPHGDEMCVCCQAETRRPATPGTVLYGVLTAGYTPNRSLLTRTPRERGDAGEGGAPK